ncbi:hypothetical protein D3C83_120050 [compost metagenome]
MRTARAARQSKGAEAGDGDEVREDRGCVAMLRKRTHRNHERDERERAGEER